MRKGILSCFTGLFGVLVFSSAALAAEATESPIEYRMRQLETRTYYLEQRVQQLENANGQGSQRFYCELRTAYGLYQGYGRTEADAARAARATCMSFEQNAYSCNSTGTMVCRRQ